MRLSDIMSHMNLTTYPIIGLVIFVIVFAAVAARAMSRKRGAEYARAAGLPLEDDRLGKPAPAGAERQIGGPR